MKGVWLGWSSHVFLSMVPTTAGRPVRIPLVLVQYLLICPWYTRTIYWHMAIGIMHPQNFVVAFTFL